MSAQPVQGGWGQEWDRVADVVVIGAGAAGGTAAAVAAEEGAEVVLLESAAHSGGTTAKSSGRLWIPNNPILQARGGQDSRQGALRYMARTAAPTRYDPDAPDLGLGGPRYRLLETIFDEGPTAIGYLQDRGIAQFEHVDYADYYTQLAEEECPSGRTIQPVLSDDARREGIKGGHHFVESLLAHVRHRGGEVLTDHRVVNVMRDQDGRVVGVLAHTGRQTVLIGARRGVVFGTGGFLHDPELAESFLRGPVYGGAATQDATGDFVRIGAEVGAQLGNMSEAWWGQVVLEQALRHRATSRDVYVTFGDSMVIVDREGQRVVNERAPYNERTQVHFTWDPRHANYPNLLLFMVFDDHVRRDERDVLHRWPIPRPGEADDHVISAETIEQLAVGVEERLAGLRQHTGGFELESDFASGLQATLEHFDRIAQDGTDPEFGRGDQPVERIWSGDARPGAASAAMHPFDHTGSYHCVILAPGALDTKGGPVVDHRARVVNHNGDPIPGLLGAGNCIASPAGRAYWGPGGTIGPAVTFGYVAGREAAASSGVAAPKSIGT